MSVLRLPLLLIRCDVMFQRHGHCMAKSMYASLRDMKLRTGGSWMHATPHEAKTYPAESDVPTQAIHSALGLSEDATLECLGVWQIPSVAP